MSVTIRLEDDVDVCRGDLLADPDAAADGCARARRRVCWMSERRSSRVRASAIKHTTRSVRAIVDELLSVVDMHTLGTSRPPERLGLNDIGRVSLRLSEPLCVDTYADNRSTGAFVLVDETTNETVGAGMVLEARA